MTGVQLTTNFGLREFISKDAERLGIDPTPSADVLDELRDTATFLQLLRGVAGPLFLTSGYRPLEYNRLLKSPDGSYHVTGHAVDVETLGDKPSNLELARMAAEQEIWDKVILEFFRPYFVHANGKREDDNSGWVHLQRAKAGRAPRGEFYLAVRDEEQGGYPIGVQAAAASYREKIGKKSGTIYLPCNNQFSVAAAAPPVAVCPHCGK